MALHKLMSERKRRICELDAESIAYYRRNPCIACEDLLGIKLIDSQKYILQQSWNKPHVGVVVVTSGNHFSVLFLWF